MSCSRKQHSDLAGREARSSNHLLHIFLTILANVSIEANSVNQDQTAPTAADIKTDVSLAVDKGELDHLSSQISKFILRRPNSTSETEISRLILVKCDPVFSDISSTWLGL